MKTLYLFFPLIFVTFISSAQISRVAVFKHELRWTDEVKFPNYFLIPEVRDSVFSETGNELRNFLKVSDIEFPAEVYYNIIPGFGKQKTDMPKGGSGNDPVIGIFSFITRATSGYAIFWNLNIKILQNNKVILDKVISHELEYFNASGYVESHLWMTAEEFQDIFKRLVRECLGFQPASDEKIVLGSLESKEQKIRAMSPPLKRNLLKINGGWKSSGDFSGLIESETDTLLAFDFREKSLEEVKPSLTPLFATLFTEVTGIDFQYDQEIKRELTGNLTFSDNQKFGIRLKSYGTMSRSVRSEDVTTNISNPVSAELYEQKEQTGYFLFVSAEKVNSTGKTTQKFNAFSGYQTQNSLGTERYERIKGSLSGKPIFAEFNENQVVIMISSADTILGVMIVENCNPEGNSISGSKVSKNKVFITPSSQGLKKPSMEDARKVEWYPFYLAENSSDESRKLCIKTLICLFFGIGNMSSGPQSTVGSPQ